MEGPLIIESIPDPLDTKDWDHKLCGSSCVEKLLEMQYCPLHVVYVSI